MFVEANVSGVVNLVFFLVVKLASTGLWRRG